MKTASWKRVHRKLMLAIVFVKLFLSSIDLSTCGFGTSIMSIIHES